MKGLRETLGWLILLLIIIPIFGASQTRERNKKRFNLILIIISFILIAGTVIGYNIYDSKHPYQLCAPLTIQRIFPEKSVDEIRKILHTQRDGTPVINIFSNWSKLSTNKLQVYFSTVSDTKPFDDNHPLSFAKPYIWIGTYEGSAHCAMVLFTPTNVIMSHSQFQPGTTNYYTNHLDYSTVILNTYFILSSDDIKESIQIF